MSFDQKAPYDTSDKQYFCHNANGIRNNRLFELWKTWQNLPWQKGHHSHFEILNFLLLLKPLLIFQLLADNLEKTLLHQVLYFSETKINGCVYNELNILTIDVSRTERTSLWYKGKGSYLGHLFLLLTNQREIYNIKYYSW